jgi:DNA-binding transcriptional LysR family regulator
LPGLTLEVQSLPTRDILRRLKRQDLTFGVTYREAIGDGDYAFQPLLTERYVLVAAGANLPPELDWREAGDLPLCLFDEEMHNRRILDGVFREFGIAPNIVLETNSVDMLWAEIRAGHAFSILPTSAIPAYLQDIGATIHTIAPERTAEIGILRPNKEVQPPLSDTAWKLISKADLQGLLDASLGDG